MQKQPSSKLEKIKHFIHFLANSNQPHPLLLFACSEVGIEFSELIPQSAEDPQAKSQPKQVNELRFSHLEARRHAKINILANYIQDNDLMKKFTLGGVNQLKRLNLTPPPKRVVNDSQVEIFTERKVKNLKRAFFHQLAVEENLKELRKKEEEEKRVIEERIREKESREVVKGKNSRLFEVRDQRIKQKLDFKRKELEEHEERGLKYVPKSVSKEKSYIFATQSRHSKVIPTQSPTDSLNISEALSKIDQKLSNSTLRAQELLLSKKLQFQHVSHQLLKVKTLHTTLLNQQEESKLQILQKLQQEQEYSSRRRNLLSEQKKFSRSLNQLKPKKIEKSFQEIDSKNEIIEKARKEVKESYEQKSQIISMKIALRKKDQEENLKRIENQKRKEKEKLLEKIKDEALPRYRMEIDMKEIKKEVRREFKKMLKDNIVE